jgi:hypothetical protein
VNTKEALNIVMGMFNSSLDIDKNLGWDNTGQDNVSLPPEIGERSLSQGYIEFLFVCSDGFDISMGTCYEQHVLF